MNLSNLPGIRGLQRQQLFLRVLIFSFVTVIIAVGFSLVRSQQTTQISPELQKLAVPLNPNLRLDIVAQIQQKKTYSDADLARFPILRVVHNISGADTVEVLNP